MNSMSRHVLTACGSAQKPVDFGWETGIHIWVGWWMEHIPKRWRTENEGWHSSCIMQGGLSLCNW